jgi:repressor LexA
MIAPNPSQTLTLRQWKLARFIAGYIRDHGFAPTLREMCEAMGIHSTNGVKGHLAALERKGFIRRTALTARSIQVLREV